MTPGTAVGCNCDMLFATEALSTIGVVVDLVVAVFVGLASSLRIDAVEDGVRRLGTKVGVLIVEAVCAVAPVLVVPVVPVFVVPEDVCVDPVDPVDPVEPDDPELFAVDCCVQAPLEQP